MNLKNKIVAFILCLFLVATGSFFVFGSAPKAQAATTNGAALSIAQLQQIVNSLLQQIQQIMQLLAQREQTQPVGTCGNLICDFGETTTCPQDCTDNSQNCADICKAQGYTNSQCNTYAISPQGFANQCAAGYVKSSVSASDCAVTPGIVGIGKSCCCGSGTATCASEGQTLYPAQKCCWGLTAVALSGCTSTGCVNNSICKKLQNCGNDVCDQGEDNLNCPQDCQLSTTPAFILASVATSSTAATAAGKASISATFNVQITAKNSDVYLPRTGAFIIDAVKNNDGNVNNWLGVNTGYPQPAGTVLTVSSIKIAKNTSATFSVQGRYELNGTATNYDLRIFEIRYSPYDNGELIGFQPQGMISQSIYLQNMAAVCGNNICDSSETTASCPSDCKYDSCIAQSQFLTNTSQHCCFGLTPAIANIQTGASGILLNYECLGIRAPYCGNGTCESGETISSCAIDCAPTKCEKAGYQCKAICASNEPAINGDCGGGMACCKKAPTGNISVSWAYPASYVAKMKQGDNASLGSPALLGLAIATGNSDVTVKKISFSFGNEAISTYLKKVYVYEGDSIVAQKEISGNGTIVEISGMGIPIPKNYSQTLLIKADVWGTINTSLPRNISVTIPVGSVQTVDQSGIAFSGPNNDLGAMTVEFDPNSQCAAAGYELGSGQSCCAGLSPLVESYSQYTDNWTCLPLATSRTLCANCGDGICGPGESYCSCHQDCCTPGSVSGCKSCNGSQAWVDDNSKCNGSVCQNGVCKTTATPNFTLSSIATSAAPTTSATPASITATFNVGIRADGGDIYMPKSGAFTVMGVKNNDSNPSNWVNTNAIYNQPSGTVFSSNSIKIPQGNTATFSVTSNYAPGNPGSFDLRMTGIGWMTDDGGTVTTYAPNLPSMWISHAVTLGGDVIGALPGIDAISANLSMLLSQLGALIGR